MYDYNNTSGDNFQALRDFYISAKSGKEKSRPWKEKKELNMLLALAYDSVNPSKAARLRECAKILTFKEYSDGTKKLDSMNSCRVRLCPVCSWRRSLKNFYNNLQIAEYLNEHDPGEWLHITLTLKSVTGDDLSNTIDAMMYAFNKWSKNVKVKKAIKGTYRGLEVTHDGREYITPEDWERRKKYLKALGLKKGDKNPTYDLYHPHFHVLCHVDKSYFKSRKYMNLEEWGKAWAQALGVDYMPSVKVQRLKDYGSGLKGAVAEVSKYSSKSSDYIIPDDWDLTVETVRTLDSALAGRRLIAYGGSCLKAQKALKLDDADTGDLINVGEENPAEQAGIDYKIVTYAWYTGFRDYGKIES